MSSRTARNGDAGRLELEDARPPAADLRVSLGLASIGAAMIHVVAGIHHLGEWWLFGAGFMVMAAAQAASAVSLARSDTRLVPPAGVALNVSIVLLWAWSRALGLPIGPDAGVPEAVGTGDALATLTELTIAGGALALITGARERVLSAWSAAATAAFVIGALTGFGHFTGHGH